MEAGAASHGPPGADAPAVGTTGSNPAATTAAALNRRLGAAEWRAVAGPIAFFLTAVALLTYDHVEGQVSAVVFWSGLALVAAAFARMLATIGRNHRDALLDDLTGLGNGAGLDSELRTILASGGERRALVLFELEGIDSYANQFGQAKAEALVRDQAEHFAATVARLEGSAYRTEGGRFVALVSAAGEGAGEILSRAATPFDGDEDAIGSCFGEIILPDDAATPELALQTVGRRLEARKQRQRRSARRQAHAALMAVLDARRPELRRHLRAVAPRAINLGRRLGLEREQLDDVVLAASLQDIGMLTVPEAILEKDGPLTEPERAMIHEHPIAGAKIVGAAPALASVATLVRATYERFDGSGYPDGLAGEEIPLGARIIAVCVAAAAMSSPRPHRPALAPDEALAELRACAGTQFDPEVVDAFATELAEESALLAAPASSRRSPARGRAPAGGPAPVT